jgi:hypothetical protein
MSRLSRNEIEKELLEEEMATIHPPANGVSYNREEQAANTHISFRRTELTAEQMIARDAELRANAPKDPDSFNAKAAADIADRQERQKAHDDKVRAELASADKAVAVQNS